MVDANVSRYLNSLGEQLRSGATRVRDLIGGRHWGVDGAHKESILRAFIASHLPAGIVCARGFVLGATDELTSTEQDILIVDTCSVAPVFSEYDLILTPPEAVVGAISVKTRLGQREIEDSINGLSTTLQTCEAPWLGVFFFDDETSQIPQPNTLYAHVLAAIAANAAIRTPLADGPQAGVDILATIDSTALILDYGTAGSTRVRGYNCHRKAASVFLARLLMHITRRRSQNEAWIAKALDKIPMEPLYPASQDQGAT